MENKEELEKDKMSLEEEMNKEREEPKLGSEDQKQEIITMEEAERLEEEDTERQIKNIQLGVATISIIAVTVASGIGMLVAHYASAPKNRFSYKVDREGKIQVSGRVKYSEVNNNWKLLEKKLNSGESKLYIVDWYFAKDGGGYINVRTDKHIADHGACEYIPVDSTCIDETVLNVENLGPYLLNYDMVYDSYTIEDMDRLLGLIEADYEYSTLEEDNKVMMKTTE